jgi:hypothetical protein
MIKTKRRRERENPPKDTIFTLRGRVVDPKDISRFERRAIKKGTITAEETLSGQGERPLSLVLLCQDAAVQRPHGGLERKGK